jgi:hypothetical protein
MTETLSQSFLPSQPGGSLSLLLRLMPVRLCWLHRTSVQEIGMLRTMEQASLPKQVRCEYNQRGPFCSYSLTTHLFSRRRGSICAACVHLNQTTPLFQLARALRTFFALDQTTDDLPFARHARRSDQRQIRVACGKRPVTTPTDHLASTDQTTCLSEDRSVSLGGSRQDGSVLETGALPCPARDASRLPS